MNHLIFVSIAAYRDPQLVPTLEDCIGKAQHPERLRFGICWQHDPHQDTLPFRSDDCFRILAVDWRDSKGACWARSEIMKLWRGEAWFLQVDSHCRFAWGWDVKLIDEMTQTESPKLILSTYASPFTPGGDEILIEGPLQMAFQGFTEDGIPHMKPMAIPDWRSLTRPRRARFLSAGFLFAPGSFIEEIGYDPELYFLGEEAAMTLRAFTSGYDLYHPRETIVWHDYGRPAAPKHWGDHSQQSETTSAWHELDSRSKSKVRRLLAGQPVESFGLGSARTLEEYEAYAGLSLKLRKAQEYTVRCGEPPNPEFTPDWEGQIFPWMVRITFDRTLLPNTAFDDPEFWYVAVKNEDRTEIYRQDIPSSQLATLTTGQSKIVLVCEFESGTIPASWTIWPVSKSLGWLRKLEGELGEEDYTIVLEDEAE
ncbi:UDP-N-acetylglucosamine-transferase [Granulicella sp. S190]|uniref:UDP-N-acetylglucosamine-transferase n=1 Tax=Granulicella sp. S190 TaxID=1747226 RepID=UPI0020B16B0D|nr:UDP-N-acetylglucosamine-transferase [Granulicella sp. S190]